jgi:hypothetical protein
MSYSLLAASVAQKLSKELTVNTDVAVAVAGAYTAAELLKEGTRAAEMLTLPERHHAAEYPDAVAVGKKVSSYILKIASSKGYENSYADWDPKEFPGTTSYPWKPTGRGEPGMEPHWGEINTLFAENERCTLVAPTDKALLSEARDLLDNFDRRSAVGGDVMWWLAGTGTPTPSGQWMRIAMFAAQDNKMSSENALEMLTKASIASSDAGIMGWREKYRHSIARPETLWKILVGDNAPMLPRETPNHPSYPSGHSLFGGSITTIITESLGNIPLRDALPPDLYVPAERRDWSSVSEALSEASRSRVNSGFHLPLDTKAGESLGKCIAENIIKDFDKQIDIYVKSIADEL